MKKCRIGLILLLCALLLCSCTQKPAPTPEPTPAPSLSAAHGVQTPAPTAAPEATPAPTEAPLETVALDDGTPRFSEMVYERPDLSELDSGERANGILEVIQSNCLMRTFVVIS